MVRSCVFFLAVLKPKNRFLLRNGWPGVKNINRTASAITHNKVPTVRLCGKPSPADFIRALRIRAISTSTLRIVMISGADGKRRITSLSLKQYTEYGTQETTKYMKFSYRNIIQLCR